MSDAHAELPVTLHDSDTPTIITHLSGGLGNQMFQYACGRALAQRLGTKLLLDTSHLGDGQTDRSSTVRSFELDVFQIQAGVASPTQLQQYASGSGMMARIKRKLFGSPSGIHSETSRRYDEAFTTWTAPCYLHGYWQSEKYFTAIASDLREKEFVPVDEPDSLNRDLQFAIRTSQCAGIHIRRGDYVTHARAASFHGTCPPEYYQRAADFLNAHHGIEKFFLFSDDPQWVKENIPLPYDVVHVSHNHGRDAFRDMMLMKDCSHQVIANSSFSWWAAWLNRNPQKIVITPSPWFADPREAIGDLLPTSWIPFPIHGRVENDPIHHPADGN